jgi:hypothetical protein
VVDAIPKTTYEIWFGGRGGAKFGGCEELKDRLWDVEAPVIEVEARKM